MNEWQAAQYADECALQQAAMDALKASRTRALTDAEAMALAYSAGLANDFYKELHRETH